MSSSSMWSGPCSCQDLECNLCFDINPFSGPINEDEGETMPDVNFQQLLGAEEDQLRDSEKSRQIYQRYQVIAQQTKEKTKWISDTKKKIKQAEKWLEEKDAEKIKLLTKKDRLEDVIRIRDDYIISEKMKYPSEFPDMS